MRTSRAASPLSASGFRRVCTGAPGSLRARRQVQQLRASLLRRPKPPRTDATVVWLDARGTPPIEEMGGMKTLLRARQRISGWSPGCLVCPGSHGDSLFAVGCDAGSRSGTQDCIDSGKPPPARSPGVCVRHRRCHHPDAVRHGCQRSSESPTVSRVGDRGTTRYHDRHQQGTQLPRYPRLDGGWGSAAAGFAGRWTATARRQRPISGWRGRRLSHTCQQLPAARRRWSGGVGHSSLWMGLKVAGR